MILKEAYRYQNYLTRLIEETSSYLRQTKNVAVIKSEHLRSKSQSGAEDQTTDNLSERDLTVPVGDIVRFGFEVIEEKEAISEAIDKAKAEFCPDVDRGLAINRVRQGFLTTLCRMAAIKKRERITFGSAYCFNAEGNQVPYRYDIKETTDVDFDRKAVKEAIKVLQTTCDETSNHADFCLTSVNVDFEPKFNINDSFEEQVEAFSAQFAG